MATILFRGYMWTDHKRICVVWNVCRHVINTLSFRLYMSHFPTGLVSSKQKIVAMTYAPTHVTMSSAHYPTFPSLHLRHSSFTNASVAFTMSQLILQPFRCFTYVTVHSPTLPLLLLRLIFQTSRHFTYVTAHSPTLPSVYLRHSSFSKPSVTSPTSQLILQPFSCSSYVTAHSPTLLSLLLRHWLFTYVTWRAVHEIKPTQFVNTREAISINFNEELFREERWVNDAYFAIRGSKNGTVSWYSTL